jgi:hypothetical protein
MRSYNSHRVSSGVILVAAFLICGAFGFSSVDNQTSKNNINLVQKEIQKIGKVAVATVATFCLMSTLSLTQPAFAADGNDGGASTVANTKIKTGGASTLQSGRTIAITRGVNLDNSDFSGQNLKGVAFQQR